VAAGPRSSTRGTSPRSAPQALTYDEVADALGLAWGRPIRYTRPGVLRYWRSLSARGVPRTMIAVTVGIYTAARLGLAGGLSDDTSLVLGRPARDVRAFAADTLVPQP
jgi:uncharacterized protein YbjT (DUF2867 family)